MNNVKNFIYVLGDFQGARLKYETSEFKYYKKINVDGFIIYYKTENFMKFGVDVQLIRRLKLKSITNNIRNNSIEDKILRLINLSNDAESENVSQYFNFSTTNSYNYNSDYYIDTVNIKEQKRFQKYQSKQINQMINRYNKTGYKK